jgi:Kdo2-lipid IVA lauroyltransferase/acyltransferase
MSNKHKSKLFRARDYLHPRYWPTWLFLGLLRLASVFPYRIQLKLGSMLGKILMRLSRKKQHIVDINLARCLPEKSPQERERIKLQCFENLGISLLEMAMGWWWKDEQLKPLGEVIGLEHIESCLNNNQGVILLTGHFTSLEIAGRLLSYYTPFQVMYRTQRNRLFDSFLYTKRNELYEATISRKNTLQLIKGIKKGIPTWYAPDQDFKKERNVFAPFFGIPTATITASARLAKSSGAAVLPYYPERKADGSGYILRIDPPLENFPSGDDLADATAINASIEKFVHLHPEQYMWVHPRFKTRPPGEPAFY